jgi:hypothetical protein
MAFFFARALVDWSGADDCALLLFQIVSENRPPPITVTPSFEFASMPTRTTLIERAVPGTSGEVERRYVTKNAWREETNKHWRYDTLIAVQEDEKTQIRERLFLEFEAQKIPAVLSILRTVLLTGMIFDRVTPDVIRGEDEWYERHGLQDGYFGRVSLPPWYAIPVTVAPVASEYRQALYGESMKTARRSEKKKVLEGSMSPLWPIARCVFDAMTRLGVDPASGDEVVLSTRSVRRRVVPYTSFSIESGGEMVFLFDVQNESGASLIKDAIESILRDRASDQESTRALHESHIRWWSMSRGAWKHRHTANIKQK